MDYINDLDKFLYIDACLNDSEVTAMKDCIDNIVLLKQAEGKVFFSAIQKIVEKGLYNNLLSLLEYHSNRCLNDPIDDLETEEAGIH